MGVQALGCPICKLPFEALRVRQTPQKRDPPNVHVHELSSAHDDGLHVTMDGLKRCPDCLVDFPAQSWASIKGAIIS